MPNRKAEAAETVMEATWRYLNGETDSLPDEYLSVVGEVKMMQSGLQEYYQDSLDYFGIEKNQARYYTIDCTNTRPLLIAEVIAMFGFGTLMTFLFISEIRHSKDE